MKKILSVLVFLLVLTCAFSVFADYQTVDVYVGGELLLSDSPAILVGSRTMVPLRAISERLGCDVNWNGDTQTAEIKNSKTAVYVTIDSDVMIKQDVKTGKKEEIKIDAPAMLYKQRTLIPLRAVSEALDAKVEWDAEKECALITLKEIETYYGMATEDGYKSELLGIKFVASDGVEMMAYTEKVDVSDFAHDAEAVDQQSVAEFGAFFTEYSANMTAAISPETSVKPEEYLEYIRPFLEGTQKGYTYTPKKGLEDVTVSGVKFKKMSINVQADKDKVNMDYYAATVKNRILSVVVLYADEHKAKGDELINAFEIAK